MAYSIPEIITWAKICQPLARVGEAKRLADGDPAADVDLDIKLYMTRKDVEYAYAQNADSAILHTMGNYLLALCGVYLFYKTYKGDFEKKTLISQLSKISPSVIIREGKAYTGGGNDRFARQILNAYNKQLRNKRLSDKL